MTVRVFSLKYILTKKINLKSLTTSKQYYSAVCIDTQDMIPRYLLQNFSKNLAFTLKKTSR